MFKDRFDAAMQLAETLKEYKNNPDVIIVAIPRGALQLGNVLAKQLNAPLDIVLTKKIGMPGQPELAIGALSLEDEYLSPAYATEPEIQQYVEKKRKELRELLQKRTELYRKGRPPINLKDKVVIITDDGIATGYTIMLAIKMVKKQQPKKIIVAIPVGPRQAVERLKNQVDEVICLLEPEGFFGISQFYNDFTQVEDKEALALLEDANR